MSIDEAIGYYTYRSFLNRPVGAPHDILWGEGELFLLISDEGNVTGTLAFPAEAGGGQKDFAQFITIPTVCPSHDSANILSYQ
jgi:hypothetical protein